MLIRILAFLLEALFFVLIGTALLRAWMNGLRINMQAQPGRFVMAVTDWLVKPLRRVLPAAIGQARVDWASLMAACAFALLYAALLSFSVNALAGSTNSSNEAMASIFGTLGFAVKTLMRVALQSLFFLVLAFAILSWVQPASSVQHLLSRLTAPLLDPLRRVVPVIGGVDLSALVLMLMLQVGMMLVN